MNQVKNQSTIFQLESTATQQDLFDSHTDDPYYNTVGIKDGELIRKRSNCSNQGRKIINVFRLKCGASLTPFDVQHHLIQYGYNYPITSIRRSITNLTNEGRLIKTDERRIGDYGEMNYCWKLNIESND